MTSTYMITCSSMTHVCSDDVPSPVKWMQMVQHADNLAQINIICFFSINEPSKCQFLLLFGITSARQLPFLNRSEQRGEKYINETCFLKKRAGSVYRVDLLHVYCMVAGSRCLVASSRQLVVGVLQLFSELCRQDGDCNILKSSIIYMNLSFLIYKLIN